VAAGSVSDARRNRFTSDASVPAIDDNSADAAAVSSALAADADVDVATEDALPSIITSPGACRLDCGLQCRQIGLRRDCFHLPGDLLRDQGTFANDRLGGGDLAGTLMLPDSPRTSFSAELRSAFETFRLSASAA